eukprot:g1877.t1
MLALKKRNAKRKAAGRGRGRGTTDKGTGDGSFSLFSTKKKRTSAELRIMNELKKNEVNLDPDVYQLWIEDDPSIPGSHLDMKLAVTPEEGRWKGVRFVFQLKFPKEPPIDYPNREPSVVLISGQKIYHPNINYEGAVCLGYRRQNPWKAAWGLKTVAYSIVAVLTNPNPENPQDGCKALLRDEGTRRQFDSNVEKALRGGTLTIEGRPCPFPSATQMKKFGNVPPGATILAGKGMGF